MYETIYDTTRLEEVIRECQKKSVIAMDTEFMRTSTYYPILGLVQIFDGTKCYLIDPLQIDDLSCLAQLLEDQSVLKVLHACSEDMEVFQYALGVTPSPTFDSQIAAAILGVGFSMSYQKLVEHYLSVQISKEQTRSDWLRRPLSAPQLEYAAIDVIHLYTVFEKQKNDLDTRSRMPWVTADCESLPSKIPTLVMPEEYYLKVKNTAKLNRPQLNLLRLICAWRERKARLLNVPRNRVVEEKSLFLFALHNPSTLSDIQDAGIFTSKQMRRYAEEFRNIIDAAADMSEENYPPSQEKSRTPVNSQTLKMLKAVVEKKALTLNIAQEVLVKRRDIEQLLRSIDNRGHYVLPSALKGWREEVIGRSLLEALRN
ncbi:MAG: ribonuclease D [Pseudomonadales bacterium]|nr:ribonuclease D [Pseudomonadales bacterium]